MIAREVAIARELIQLHKRDRALLALKKKKLQEGQLANLDSWLLNVEEVVSMSFTFHAHVVLAIVQYAQAHLQVGTGCFKPYRSKCMLERP